jgi:hypothetical protein
MLFPPLTRQLLLTATLVAALFTPCPTTAADPLPIRTCTVKEVLKGGMYVYLRCRAGDQEVWLATVDTPFTVDEELRYIDAPPMTDFHSKFLGRTFPSLVLTEIQKVKKTPQK